MTKDILENCKISPRKSQLFLSLIVASEELTNRYKNHFGKSSYSVLFFQFAGSNNTANDSPTAGSPSTVVFPRNPQATSSFSLSLLNRRPWNVESLDSVNNSPLALVQSVARATDQMNRAMQEKEQRELDRVQLRMHQNRRETEIRMRRNREMRERERREIRRSSGWRDWQEAVPGPWSSCSLDEVINMSLFCLCPFKKTINPLSLPCSGKVAPGSSD